MSDRFAEVDATERGPISARVLLSMHHGEQPLSAAHTEV